MNQLEDHFYELARKNKVIVLPLFMSGEGVPELQGFSCRTTRSIQVMPIRDIKTYLVALHELGHVLGPWQSQCKLLKEAGAWKWAKENALEWDEGKIMKSGLRSYLACAILSSYSKRPWTVPPRSHPAWQYIPQIETPSWLHNELLVIPWKDILASPKRPRCGLCRFWKKKSNSKDGICKRVKSLRVVPETGHCSDFSFIW